MSSLPYIPPPSMHDIIWRSLAVSAYSDYSDGWRAARARQDVEEYMVHVLKMYESTVLRMHIQKAIAVAMAEEAERAKGAKDAE